MSFNPFLTPLLHLQGDIKVHLLLKGLSQEAAHRVAGEVTDIIGRSQAVTPDIRAAYLAIAPAPDVDTLRVGDWMVLESNEGFTVRLRLGKLYRFMGYAIDYPDHGQFEGIGSCYSLDRFRRATPEEVAIHLEGLA